MTFLFRTLMSYFRVASHHLHKHRILYRHALALIVYDVDTLHLMTRHHRPIPAKGYLFPLTSSSWFMFISLVIIVLIIMHIGNFFIRRKYDLFQIFPLIFLFHYEESSYMLTELRTGKALILLSVLIFFSFINVYNQNIRSSTIEPFFESLPDHVDEVNMRTSYLTKFEFVVASTSGLTLQHTGAIEDGPPACNTMPDYLRAIYTCE